MIALGRVQTLARRWWEQDRSRRDHGLVQARFADYRLVIPALAVWALTALWIHAGMRYALLMVLVCSVFLYGLARWVKSMGWGAGRMASGSTLALLALLLCAGQALLLVGRVYESRWSFLDAVHGRSVRVEGTVLDSVPAASPGSHLTTLRTSSVSVPGKELVEPITLRVYTDTVFELGSEVAGAGKLEVNGTYYRLEGSLRQISPSETENSLATVRQSIRDKAEPAIGADKAALLLGLAYGDDSLLTQDAQSAMRTAGLTHLTAVSGSNITLIFLLVYRLLAYLRWARPVLVLTGFLATTGYVALVGLDGSVLRAWAMGLVGVLALILGHGAYRVSALSSCVLLLLFINPELATQYGFVLSVVATAALLFIAPLLVRLLSSLLPTICAELIAIPLAAALWCLPVLLILSEAIYPYTVLANLLAAPLVAPITLAGLASFALLALPATGSLAIPFLHAGGWCAELLLAIARGVSALPGSSVEVGLSPLSFALVLLSVIGVSWLLFSTDRALTRRNQPHRLGPASSIHHQGRGAR